LTDTFPSEIPYAYKYKMYIHIYTHMYIYILQITLGVFDGHGPYGDTVAAWLAANLPFAVQSALNGYVPLE